MLAMLFNFALISSFLLAPAVLAGRRREGRQSQFMNRVEKSTNAASESGGVEFTTNWAWCCLARG